MVTSVKAIPGLNRPSHRLSAVVAILLVIIGLTEPLQLPVPRFLPPSWQVIYLLLPNGFDWLYPAAWTLAGLVSVAGFRWAGPLRWGFRLTAMLFFSWGLAGIPAITMKLGGNVQGVSANLITAILAWNASYSVGVAEHGDEMNAGLVELDRKVHEASEHGSG